MCTCSCRHIFIIIFVFVRLVFEKIPKGPGKSISHFKKPIESPRSSLGRRFGVGMGRVYIIYFLTGKDTLPLALGINVSLPSSLSIHSTGPKTSVHPVTVLNSRAVPPLSQGDGATGDLVEWGEEWSSGLPGRTRFFPFRTRPSNPGPENRYRRGTSQVPPSVLTFLPSRPVGSYGRKEGHPTRSSDLL